MNALVNPLPSRPALPGKVWLEWFPVVAGLMALYLPTYWTLWNGVWNTEEQGHGPLILAVIVWMVWQKRQLLLDSGAQTGSRAGWPVLIFGLLMYALGRSQDILFFEVASHIPVLAGVVLIMRGGGALRVFWFPVFFFVFMIPLPGMVVDALTNPLKRHVSEIAESLLYLVGYPIARSGVTLTIGPYQLLVADACSGMHSLYSLSALGLLYLYLVKHRSLVRNGVLALSILPIAFGANIVRVIFLVLVTYYLGDEAGQGFLHGFAGMVLFVAALLMIFLLDSLLGVVGRRGRAGAVPE